MPLYQKYRPKKLSQVRGNEETKQALTKMLTEDRENCPHVFLFHGETGCGKTTLARIVANMLGCNIESSDYSEINFADLRGIDTIREIIKQSQFTPFESDCRVWVMDECQKMTGDAQNALLKILEDTPSHVYFILCTTDPQKLLSTIRGRCSSFQVKTLDEDNLTSLLIRITIKEGKEQLSEEIYQEIIKSSEGRVRNAIQTLEQVLSVSEGQRIEIAKKSNEEQKQAIDLCRALINPKTNWKTVQIILNGLKETDPERIRRAVIGYASNTLLNKDMVICGLILDEFSEDTFINGFNQIVRASYSVIKNR